MPFDAAEIDLSKPSLIGLAVILRDKSKWPEGHKWSYTSRCMCAMGIVKEKWGKRADVSIKRALKITDAQQAAIFYSAHVHVSREFIYVTPEDVASVIDKVIAGEI